MHNGVIPSEEGSPISFFGFWKAVLTLITEFFSVIARLVSVGGVLSLFVKLAAVGYGGGTGQTPIK